MIGTSFEEDFLATGFGGYLALPIIRDRSHLYLRINLSTIYIYNPIYLFVCMYLLFLVFVFECVRFLSFVIFRNIFCYFCFLFLSLFIYSFMY